MVQADSLVHEKSALSGHLPQLRPPLQRQLNFLPLRSLTSEFNGCIFFAISTIFIKMLCLHTREKIEASTHEF